MTTSSSQRILAINPGMQYLGAAIFESEAILWYGIKTFPGKKTMVTMRPQVEQFLAGLIEKYAPAVLVVEEPFYAQSLLSSNLRKLTEQIKAWAKWHGLRVRSYYPPEVKAFFCRDQRTKQSLAEAMIATYPFLAKYLSPLPWKRRYWFHVFDAVGLGLMCQRKLAR
jgi:RNase H-fold protein (predicted Holliday junction resolvase)